jgi:hypothetical protein
MENPKCEMDERKGRRGFGMNNGTVVSDERRNPAFLKIEADLIYKAAGFRSAALYIIYTD